MNVIQKIGTCSVFILFLLPSLEAQESEFKNNYIYCSAGTSIFQHQGSVSYERMVYSEDKMRLNIKANVGWLTESGLDLDTDEKILKHHKSISAVMIFQLFEANLGVALTEYKLARGFMPTPGVDYTQVLNGKKIYAGFGLRFENESILFRIGLSNLEYLNASLGFMF